MSDIETSDWSEIAANNIQPAPGGWPANSSPMIVYSNGREDMGAIKRDWNRRNPTVTSGGSANAQSLTYTQGPTAYVQGQTFTFIAGFSNSGACTLNVNGLGAKAIQLNGASLAAGAIIAGSITQCMYDNAGNFQLTLAASGAYLPLTGGTLTGNLAVNSPDGGCVILNGTSGQTRALIGQTGGLTRWQIVAASLAAESTGNAGSDFSVSRFSDAGAFIDTPLLINRASGAVTITSTVGSNLKINGPTGQNRIIQFDTNASDRWAIYADGNAEGGSNAGSNLGIGRYSDAGAFIDAPLSISRASGVATFTVAPTIPSMTIAGPAGTNRLFNFTTTTGGATPGARFQMYVSSIAESGSSAGSNFGLDAYTDAAIAANVFSVARSTRVVNFAVAIVNGPSDRSLKENIAPLEDSLDKVLALQGVSFDFIGKEGRQIGLIAQDVAPIVPEVIQDYQSQDGEGQPTAGLLALDYPKLTALLVEAIKELNAKVMALEARLPPETLTA